MDLILKGNSGLWAKTAKNTNGLQIARYFRTKLFLHGTNSYDSLSHKKQNIRKLFCGEKLEMQSQQVYFLLPCPTFDLHLAYECEGVGSNWFGVHKFDWFVTSGVGSAFSIFVFQKSLLGIV